MHWITGLGVGLVYMHMRSQDLGKRVRAATESVERAPSTTDVSRASIRQAREHSGKGVEFAPIYIYIYITVYLLEISFLVAH
jgi:hypothetical protein